MNPLNLALRFVLELAALASVGYWGWNQGQGITQFVFLMGLLILWMAIWGLFNVPDDPSRSGKAPIRVPGIVRLVIEIDLFALAVIALLLQGLYLLALGLALLIIVHYIASMSRIRWLLKH